MTLDEEIEERLRGKCAALLDEQQALQEQAEREERAATRLAEYLAVVARRQQIAWFIWGCFWKPLRYAAQIILILWMIWRVRSIADYLTKDRNNPESPQ